MYDMQKAMVAADSTLPEMTSVNSESQKAEQLMTYFSSLSYNKVKSYFLVYSKAGKADEIAVIELKDASDADEAAETLKKHAQKRVSLYKTYEPSQCKRAQSAKVFTYENYAVLIISDKQDDVQKAFYSFLKK